MNQRIKREEEEAKIKAQLEEEHGALQKTRGKTKKDKTVGSSEKSEDSTSENEGV